MPNNIKFAFNFLSRESASLTNFFKSFAVFVTPKGAVVQSPLNIILVHSGITKHTTVLGSMSQRLSYFGLLSTSFSVCNLLQAMIMVLILNLPKYLSEKLNSFESFQYFKIH